MAVDQLGRRRIALRLAVGLAAAAFALGFGRDAGRLAMFVLLTVSGISLIVFVRLADPSGRWLGMRPWIWLFGVGLVLLLALLLFGP